MRICGPTATSDHPRAHDRLRVDLAHLLLMVQHRPTGRVQHAGLLGGQPVHVLDAHPQAGEVVRQPHHELDVVGVVVGGVTGSPPPSSTRTSLPISSMSDFVLSSSTVGDAPSSFSSSIDTSS